MLLVPSSRTCPEINGVSNLLECKYFLLLPVPLVLLPTPPVSELIDFCLCCTWSWLLSKRELEEHSVASRCELRGSRLKRNCLHRTNSKIRSKGISRHHVHLYVDLCGLYQLNESGPSQSNIILNQTWMNNFIKLFHGITNMSTRIASLDLQVKLSEPVSKKFQMKASYRKCLWSGSTESQVCTKTIRSWWWIQRIN